MIIRTATLADLPQITEIGAKCYSVEEALTKEEYRDRLMVYPHHFWILEKDEEILAFINGPVTNIDHITDEMFHNSALHQEDGAWQAILGVNTSPKHQKKRICLPNYEAGDSGCTGTRTKRVCVDLQTAAYRLL